MTALLTDTPRPGDDHTRLRPCCESEAATAALESRIEAVADLIHEACVAEWERRAARDPGRLLTLHGPDAHHAEVRVALGLVP